VTFHGLRMGSYGALLVDPPWRFEVRSESMDISTTRRTERHYGTMTRPALADLPVAALGKPDCCLFLWVVDTHLDQGIELGKQWGFTFKTRAFEWLKTSKDGTSLPIGLGFWSRKQTESCLLFTRGSPKRKNRDVPQVIEEPRRAHSQKPDEIYRRIERLVEGPYAELFARQIWPGWDGWGNEYPSSLELAFRQFADTLRRAHAPPAV
jgi:N6-adenosine-specific RNA methylase IME4